MLVRVQPQAVPVPGAQRRRVRGPQEVPADSHHTLHGAHPASPPPPPPGAAPARPAPPVALGYPTTVVEDAVTALSAPAHTAALRALRDLGATVTSTDALLTAGN
ncbi:isochorismatase family protein [Kitasatospora xanthocidica]|uniref:isochorismatase family protein n=1 Tax=Kitasatospora xanthocidica TaxID=83382 RepID=UPI001678BDF2